MNQVSEKWTIPLEPDQLYSWSFRKRCFYTWMAAHIFVCAVSLYKFNAAWTLICAPVYALYFVAGVLGSFVPVLGWLASAMLLVIVVPYFVLVPIGGVVFTVGIPFWHIRNYYRNRRVFHRQQLERLRKGACAQRLHKPSLLERAPFFAKPRIFDVRGDCPDRAYSGEPNFCLESPFRAAVFNASELAVFLN